MTNDIIYSGWLNFRGVLIFVVFVEGSIHEFQYPRNCNFLYELWRKIPYPRILNPLNGWILSNPRKLVPTKIKPSTVVIKWVWGQQSFCQPRGKNCCTRVLARGQLFLSRGWQNYRCPNYTLDNYFITPIKMMKLKVIDELSTLLVSVLR